MKIKIKKTHPDAEIPKQANPGDAGLDLHAMVFLKENDLYIEFDTGIAIEIPENHVGLLFPRSSISNYDCMLANSVGVIDPGYRDSIKVRLRKLNLTEEDLHYKIGDKVAQLIILPVAKVELVESKDLSCSERGSKSFGSSGN
jgi:dUTP pyrophosphatase